MINISNKKAKKTGKTIFFFIDVTLKYRFVRLYVRNVFREEFLWLLVLSLFTCK